VVIQLKQPRMTVRMGTQSQCQVSTFARRSKEKRRGGYVAALPSHFFGHRRSTVAIVNARAEDFWQAAP